MRRAHFLLAAAICGCSGLELARDGATDGDPGARFRAQFDPAVYCDQIGTLSVVLRARAVGCVQEPPAPCTLPTPPLEFRSESLTCPSGEPSVQLEAVVDWRGRYHVDLVQTLDQGTTQHHCGTVNGDIETLVDTPELDANMAFDVTLTDQPCPEP